MLVAQISQSKIKLVGSMAEVVANLDSPEVPQIRSHYLLNVISKEGRLMVAIPGGVFLAQLNEQVNESLRELVETGEIQLQALVHKKKIFE